MRAGLLLLDEFGAVLGGVDVRPPLLGVCLGLDLELVGHPLALQLPIVFVDGRVDDLLLFVNCSHANVLLIIDVVLFGHIRLVDQLFVVLVLISLLIRLGLVPNISQPLLGRVLVLRFFKCKIFAFEALGGEQSQDDKRLLSASSF